MTVTTDRGADAELLAGHPEFSRLTLQFGELVTIPEAAKRLARPESTLRRWLSEQRFQVLAQQGGTPLVGWGEVVEAEWQARHPPKRPRVRDLTNREQTGGSVRASGRSDHE